MTKAHDIIICTAMSMEGVRKGMGLGGIVNLMIGKRERDVERESLCMLSF